MLNIRPRSRSRWIKRSLLSALVLALAAGAGLPALAQTEPSDMEAECHALMTMAPDAPTEPTLRIESPADSEVIYGNEVTVLIAPENFDLSQGGHWHVWVDGQLRGMVYEPATVLELAPGTHRICASLGNAEHMDLGVPDGIVITVREAGPGTPTSPAPVLSAPAPQPEERTLNPVVLVAVLIVGAIAAFAGWMLGKQLPTGRK